MTRTTPLLVLTGVFLITSDVAIGLSHRRAGPVVHPRARAEAKVVVPDEPVLEMTLPAVIITVPARRSERPTPLGPATLNAAMLVPPPEIRDLRCGAWRPLATDESQTVRYCEPQTPTN